MDYLIPALFLLGTYCKVRWHRAYDRPAFTTHVFSVIALGLLAGSPMVMAFTMIALWGSVLAHRTPWGTKQRLYRPHSTLSNTIEWELIPNGDLFHLFSFFSLLPLGIVAMMEAFPLWTQVESQTWWHSFSWGSVFVWCMTFYARGPIWMMNRPKGRYELPSEFSSTYVLVEGDDWGPSQFEWAYPRFVVEFCDRRRPIHAG